MTRLSMNIGGMTCGHCVGSVTRALEEIDGVVIERVTLGTASVEYDGGRTSPADIAQAIEREGYRVTAAA